MNIYNKNSKNKKTYLCEQTNNLNILMIQHCSPELPRLYKHCLHQGHTENTGIQSFASLIPICRLY